MKTNRISLVFVALFCASQLAWGADVSPGAESLARLQQGNARFVSDRLQPKDVAGERAAMAKGQSPYAIILACADSRLSPEIIFDESLGRLFVVRVAGNVVDPVVLGSIEYAAQVLKSPLLLVLGHDSCGAVSAAIAGGPASPNLTALVQEIVPAAEEAKKLSLDAQQTLDAAIRANVRHQMTQAIAASPVLAGMVAQHQLQIVGGVYHLDSGQVEILPEAKK